MNKLEDVTNSIEAIIRNELQTRAYMILKNAQTIREMTRFEHKKIRAWDISSRNPCTFTLEYKKRYYQTEISGDRIKVAFEKEGTYHDDRDSSYHYRKTDWWVNIYDSEGAVSHDIDPLITYLEGSELLYKMTVPTMGSLEPSKAGI